MSDATAAGRGGGAGSPGGVGVARISPIVSMYLTSALLSSRSDGLLSRTVVAVADTPLLLRSSAAVVAVVTAAADDDDDVTTLLLVDKSSGSLVAGTDSLVVVVG